MFKCVKTKMKKFWLFILGLFTISFIWNFTQAKDYEYTNLDITANILNDGTIDINEDFTVNFFVDKHWIIRSIPLDYTVWWKKFLNFTFWWTDFHIDISNINVEWKNFTTSNNNWNIEIKIWDANRTLIWRQNYPISYSTYGLIRNFSWMGYAELYWNLVWYDFDTNINNVRAELILPKIYTWLTKDDFLITTDWKSKTIDWFEWSVDWSRWDRIIITYNKWLSAYHGITLAIKFPNNYFTFDHTKQASLWWHIGPSFWNSLVNRFIAFIARISNLAIFTFRPIILLIMVFGIYSLAKKIKRKINWRRYKKWGNLKWKLAKKFPVIIQYTPPSGVSSAEASLLLNRRAEPISLISLIYKWASEGLISISVEYKKDKHWNNTKKIQSITFNRLGEIDKSAPSYEKRFFKFLWNSNSKKISNSWDINISVSRLASLEKYWTDKGWLIPYKYEDFFKSLPRILSFICIPSFIILLCISPIWIISFPIFIFLIIFSNSYYNKRKSHKIITETWAKVLSHILWYRKFLITCDEEILRTFLKKDPLFLDKALPYATVFGIDSELINKILPIMEDLNINPNRCDSGLNDLDYLISWINSYTPPMPYEPEKSWWWSWWASYSSDSWWDSWSSFSGWWSSFSSGWGGWWWGWRSW